jgi:hypothetical protein
MRRDDVLHVTMCQCEGADAVGATIDRKFEERSTKG